VTSTARAGYHVELWTPTYPTSQRKPFGLFHRKQLQPSNPSLLITVTLSRTSPSWPRSYTELSAYAVIPLRGLKGRGWSVGVVFGESLEHNTRGAKGSVRAVLGGGDGGVTLYWDWIKELWLMTSSWTAVQSGGGMVACNAATPVNLDLWLCSMHAA
ncbi:hypothetical protein O988_09721, partial [Pseudogymnoascus sp. VKM F-3808]